MKRRSWGPWLLIACGVGLILFLVFRPADEPKDEQQLKVSLDTTNITSQLQDHQLPDLVEQLNTELREGVDPASNAEAALRRILGPAGIPTELRDRYYQLLGIPLPNLEGTNDFFTSFTDFLRSRGLTPDNSTPDIAIAMRRAWADTEYPVLAEWLQKNAEQLDAAVAATNLSQMYVPLVHENQRGPSLIGLLLPAVQQHRELAQALTCRATLLAKKGDVENAWQDLLACHRLARHLANGGLLTEALVAISIEKQTCVADRVVAGAGRLSAPQARNMERDLRELAALPGLEKHLDRAERLAFVDSVLNIAQQGPSALQQLAEQTERLSNRPQRTNNARNIERLVNSVIDWDAVLEIGHEYFDQLAAAASAPTPIERMAQIELVEERLRQQFQQRNLLEMLAAGKQQRSRMAAIGILRFGIPAITKAVRSRDAAIGQMQLSRLTLLLRAYEADHGRFPTNLTELQPDYVAQVPIDPLTGQPYQYHSDGRAARLRSLGLNERQDDPNGDPLKPDGDDVLVELSKP